MIFVIRGTLIIDCDMTEEPSERFYSPRKE